MFSFIASTVLVPKVVEHPAGIGRRLKTQEVLMKALIFRETGEPKNALKLEEIPTPPLATGEALVQVLLCPIHASDLQWCGGDMASAHIAPPALALKPWEL